MILVKVELHEGEYQALSELAQRERRRVPDQAAVLIGLAMHELGALHQERPHVLTPPRQQAQKQAA